MIYESSNLLTDRLIDTYHFEILSLKSIRWHYEKVSRSESRFLSCLSTFRNSGGWRANTAIRKFLIRNMLPTASDCNSI